MHFNNTFLSLLALSGITLAHPGHNVAEEAAERAEFIKREPRSVRACANQLKARGHYTAGLRRREALLHNIRKKRQLASTLITRDFAAYNFSHEATNVDSSAVEDPSSLFSDNSSCILQPEVTQGPYFVNGELVRTNLTETQLGVPMYLDIQVVDTSVCEPVNGTYMEIWNCNSTGVYSGVVANGNGNSNDTNNINKTFLRGIQPTDEDGIAQFETLVPGHYTGRATHIHVMTHAVTESTVRANKTLATANATDVLASHVGQIFFDQDLISLVEASSPYNENTQDITLNADDGILASEVDTMDPFVEYVMLGDKIEDGILAWISLGIDPTQSEDVSAAAVITEDGGYANENSGGAPDGSGPPSNSTQ